jgi:hypothetical protein
MTGTRTYFFEPFSPPPLSPHSTETYEPHPPTPYSPIYFRALDHTKYDVRNTYSETHPIRKVSTTHSCTVDEGVPRSPWAWDRPLFPGTSARGFASQPLSSDPPISSSPSISIDVAQILQQMFWWALLPVFVYFSLKIVTL